MRISRSVQELRSSIKELKDKFVLEGKSASVGFVPTMGYLHEGHTSLLRRSAAENDITILSIFVNPLQFGPNEDFSRYPRDEGRDLGLAEANGVQIVFMPPVEVMYPKETQTIISVSGVSEELCGASRPGHFDGVATVVAKLFHLVQPDRAYFGLKDAQQVAVIEQMVHDLNFPVEVVPCPIVRESDGLALSSRNVYLSDEERSQALVLNQALQLSDRWLKELENPRQVKEKIIAHIKTAPLADIDYVELVEYPGICPVYSRSNSDLLGQRLLIAVAVRFGKTRLIDNQIITVSAE